MRSRNGAGALSKNPNMPTGEVEVVPDAIEVLGRCRYNALPFQINHSREADESLRLKYRYLDLRNPEVKKNIVLRSKVVSALRSAMADHDFLEITTPILTASSPEGARDYLVSARKHPGMFYALPQAPQQFKQLLMTSGFDRYFRLLPASGTRMPRGDRKPANSISWIWKWPLLPRKMFLRCWRMSCRPIFAKYGTYSGPPRALPADSIPGGHGALWLGQARPAH